MYVLWRLPVSIATAAPTAVTTVTIVTTVIAGVTAVNALTAGIPVTARMSALDITAPLVIAGTRQ